MFFTLSWLKKLFHKSSSRTSKKIYKRNQNLMKHGAGVLLRFRQALAKENLKFWLTSGTLLGAYREHGLLSHDLDMDVAMFAEDMEKVKQTLITNGFRLRHEFGVTGEGIKEQAYSYKDVHIDIFFVEKINNQFIHYVFWKEKKDHEIKVYNVIQMQLPETDFIEYDFLDSKFLIPEKTEEYLTANYGPDFMIPNKNWSYTKDIYSAVYYSLAEKQGYKIKHKK